MGVVEQPDPAATRPLVVDFDRRRFGTRCVLAVVFSLCPIYFALFVLPLLPLLLGHVRPPGVLLSNIMAERATYQSLYIICFGCPMVFLDFLMTDVVRHLRERGVQRQALNSFMVLIIAVVSGGLLMLLAFNFEDGQDSLESRAHNWLHNIGTIMVFAGAGFAAFIYTSFIQPQGEKLLAFHEFDASWLRILGRQLTWGACIAAVVRACHLTWPLTWAYPMLIVECYVIALMPTLVVLGHLRLFMHLDATDPLLDLSFIASGSKQS